MSRPTRPSALRRGSALVAASGAAAALALVPSSAHAAVSSTFQAEGSADARYTGSATGADCTLTSGDDSPNSPLKTFTGSGARAAKVSINATFTNSVVPTDQVSVKGSYTSRIVVKTHKKDLTSMTMSGAGRLAVTNTLHSGSDCSGSGSLEGFGEMQFTEHRAGHLVLTRTTVKSALSLVVLINQKTQKVVVFDFFEGGQSNAVAKAAIKPGSYLIEEAASGIVAGNGGVLLKSGSAPRVTKLHTGLTLVFTPKKKHR